MHPEKASDDEDGETGGRVRCTLLWTCQHGAFADEEIVHMAGHEGGARLRGRLMQVIFADALEMRC